MKPVIVRCVINAKSRRQRRRVAISILPGHDSRIYKLESNKFMLCGSKSSSKNIYPCSEHSRLFALLPCPIGCQPSQEVASEINTVMSLLKWKMQTTCQTRGCLKTNGQAYQQYLTLEIKFTDITNAPTAQLLKSGMLDQRGE